MFIYIFLNTDNGLYYKRISGGTLDLFAPRLFKKPISLGLHSNNIVASVAMPQYPLSSGYKDSVYTGCSTTNPILNRIFVPKFFDTTFKPLGEGGTLTIVTGDPQGLYVGVYAKDTTSWNWKHYDDSPLDPLRIPSGKFISGISIGHGELIPVPRQGWRASASPPWQPP